MEDFVCEEDLDKLFIEEEGRSARRRIQYPSLEISSQELCHWFQMAVNGHRPYWRRDREQARVQEKIKEEAANAKQMKKVKLEEEARKSMGNTEPKGRTRVGKVLRSLRIMDLKRDTQESVDETGLESTPGGNT